MGDERADDEQDVFVQPEAMRPPPILTQKPHAKSDASSSYILAGTNHFSKVEVAEKPRNLARNLFVYGRLMFPSVLRAVAAQSIKGTYSVD